MDLFSNPRSIYFDQILISDRCTPNYNLPLVHNGSGAASKYCTFCNRVMIVLNEYSIYLSLRARNASISQKCYLTKSSRVAAGSEDNIFPHYKFKVLLGFQMLLFTGIYTVALGSVWLVSVIGTWGAQQFWLASMTCHIKKMAWICKTNKSKPCCFKSLCFKLCCFKSHSALLRSINYCICSRFQVCNESVIMEVAFRKSPVVLLIIN